MTRGATQAAGRGRLRAGMLGLAGLAVALATPACAVPKHEAPVPAATLALMAARDVAPSAPILVRAFKRESEIEIWKQTRAGRFVLLKTFPICRWSGQLGPKLRTGDRQVPEGFYTVARRQMNPNSAYHLSFDIGYPNAYDRAHGATGAYIMVHGICSSAGCFAMTNEQVGEIYGLARDAFAGGQAAFQFQSFPFRMSAAALARHRTDPNLAFWRQLKEGFDRFEATGEVPSVSVEGGRYVFAPYRNPATEALAAARRADEDARTAALVAGGAAAVRTTYADGGQHERFAALLRRGVSLGDVSRPEALPFAGREIVLIAARTPKRPACPGPECRTEIAATAGAVVAAPVEAAASRLAGGPLPSDLFASVPFGWPGAALPAALVAPVSMGGAAAIVPPRLSLAGLASRE